MKTNTEVGALRRRVDKERTKAEPGRVRFSEPLKREVVKLSERPEWSRDRLAEALGIAPSALFRWCKQIQHGQGVLESQAQAGFRQVRVVPNRATAAQGALTLELKNGSKVHGLTVAQLAQLLEATA